jgi:hypothetical protein
LGKALIIWQTLHCILDARKIIQFQSRRRLPEIAENLGHSPAPTFRVAVGKRQTSTLTVAVCGHVEPHRRPIREFCRVAKLGIEERIGVFVNEDKEAAGRWAQYGGKLPPTG